MGERLSVPHIRSLIIVVISFSTVFGMPCTVVRYCDIPAGPIWAMCFFPSMDGLHCDQFFIKERILCRVGIHIDALSTPFPIHAPKILTAEPSSAMRTEGGITSVCGVFIGSMHRVLIIMCLYSGDPIGITSVLSLLNLAFAAVHHLFRMIHS